MSRSAAADDPGHVFLVHGDLGRLSCDDVLIPTDAELRITRGFHQLMAGRLADDSGYARRVRPEQLTRFDTELALLDEDGPEARRWLVDTVTDDVRELLGRVERFAATVAHHRSGESPRHGRAKRLLALPLVGTGEGGAAGRRGDVIAAMLPLLADLAVRLDVDLALVLHDRRDAAAAHEVRRRLVADWPLDPEVLERADRLAELAQQGMLALFVGAGVSRAAGLPMWDELLHHLADIAGLDESESRHLDQLAPPDSAQLLYRRLGRERFAGEMSALFDRDAHALSHALLAALPVSTAVTTNWDPLLEHAYAGAGRRVRVLPHEPAPAHLTGPCTSGDTVELVKLHGDVGRPDDIVLTRESYLRLAEEQTALAGVVQALLLTQHMLFVGFSLLDDTFIRIAHQTRRVLQRAQASAQPGGTHVGTVLALRDDPVRRELWEKDLNFISLSPAGTSLPVAARRLEVFLDRVASSATAGQSGWLLDPRYSALRSAPDEALAQALDTLSAQQNLYDSPAWRPVHMLLSEQLGGGGPDQAGRTDA